MDDFLKETYCILFKIWILNQKNDNFSITLKDDDHILIQSQKCQGHIFFYEMNIIELKITNLTLNKDEFYLHFQMDNFKHAIQLFYEMIDCIKQIENEKSIRVLLSCTGGLTTSYFAMMLNETCELLHLNIHVDAIAYTKIYSVIKNYDIVFLAPQISYLISNVKQLVKSIPVLAIPVQVFAKYDAKGFIDTVLDALSENHSQEDINISLQKMTTKRKNILILSIFRDKERIHVTYRYYDKHQNLIIEKEIIKLKITIQDLFDIIHYIIATYHELDIIGISTPGFITKKGMLISTSLNGFNDCYIYELFHKEFKQTIYIYNDVNSAAAGYYASQTQYENLAFVFQPMSNYPGSGIVINGQLIRGQANLAGEIQYSSRHLKEVYFKEKKTHKEIMQILANDVITIISVVDPEIIVIYTGLIEDTKDLHKELAKVLPEEEIPMMKMIKNINEYILIGLLHLCLN